MRSPFLDTEPLVRNVRVRKPAFDIGVVRQKNLRRPMTQHIKQRVLPHPLSLVDKHNRNFDIAWKEKRTFLLQLTEQSPRDVLQRLLRKWEMYYRCIKHSIIRHIPNFSVHRMLYGSLVGGVAFGMVSMAFIEHFFGPGVFARDQDVAQSAETNIVTDGDIVLEEDANTEQAYENTSDVFFEYFNETADEQYQDNVTNMVKGYPLEEMLPYIFEHDRLTVAFLIGIAKKESNWGKRIPVLNNQDCFNYWGYRGVRRMMGTGGHTCFNSRKDAVTTVAKRLDTLIHSEKLNTPEKMIVWKCGFSCSGHSRESVKKWISDVDMYFKELSDE
ncbi:MAG TPA: hypothetical protein VJH89_04285 [Patescibacteria group bacterium]|nr:hypothetical protein [Patescibacteria group bacterium]